jgi:hypothetical protein
MGSSRPAIIGKPGIENLGQSGGIIAVGGSSDIGRARDEVFEGLSVGFPTVIEQVEAGSGNRTTVVEHLRAILALARVTAITARIKVAVPGVSSTRTLSLTVVIAWMF